VTDPTPPTAEDHYYAGIDFFGAGKLEEGWKQELRDQKAKSKDS
jgi:hypothetical protein